MKKSPSDALVIEMDGQPFHLQGLQLQDIPELASLNQDKWLLTDFQGASPVFMTVEAPARFAEIVARKRLQESGEAEENVRILTHWKRPRGKSSTEIFCTPVKGELFGAYEDRALEDDHHHLFFSTNALLYAVLKHYSRENHTVAVLFEHGRHVDILVGRSGQVSHATRVSSFAASSEAKSTLSDSVAAELLHLMGEHRIRVDEIIHYGWLHQREISAEVSTADNGPSDPTQWVRQLAEGMGTDCQVIPMEVHALSGDERLETSLTSLLAHLDSDLSASSFLDRFRYRAQRWMPWVTLITLFAVAGLFFVGSIYQRQADALNQESARFSQVSAGLNQAGVLDPAFKEQVAFVERLHHYRDVPSLQQILLEISQSRSGPLFLDQVELAYDPQGQAIVVLTGRIETPFMAASQHLDRFLHALTQHPFSVIDSRLNTDTTHIGFAVKLLRGKS
ncbi:MAG: hypothetical protein HQL52_18740 [Magnetococcales bacterium]|nr:hypothetical protein [Magnetococcales bacterium]